MLYCIGRTCTVVTLCYQKSFFVHSGVFLSHSIKVKIRCRCDVYIVSVQGFSHLIGMFCQHVRLIVLFGIKKIFVCLLYRITEKCFLVLVIDSWITLIIIWQKTGIYSVHLQDLTCQDVPLHAILGNT